MKLKPGSAAESSASEGTESGLLGHPDLALNTAETTLTRAIEDTTAAARKSGDPGGVLRFQAYKNAQARMLIYQQRYQIMLRLLNNGKLPEDWYQQVLNSDTYVRYNHEMLRLQTALPK